MINLRKMVEKHICLYALYKYGPHEKSKKNGQRHNVTYTCIEHQRYPPAFKEINGAGQNLKRLKAIASFRLNIRRSKYTLFVQGIRHNERVRKLISDIVRSLRATK